MKPLCCNVLIQKHCCIVANCGKVLQVNKTTHVYGTPQRLICTFATVSVWTGVCLVAHICEYHKLEFTRCSIAGVMAVHAAHIVLECSSALWPIIVLHDVVCKAVVTEQENRCTALVYCTYGQVQCVACFHVKCVYCACATGTSWLDWQSTVCTYCMENGSTICIRHESACSSRWLPPASSRVSSHPLQGDWECAGQTPDRTSVLCY
jgi:hypothetical protein